MVDFAPAIAIAAGRYVLVIASKKKTVPFGTKTARAWIDAGASYIYAWGPIQQWLRKQSLGRGKSRITRAPTIFAEQSLKCLGNVERTVVALS
jgi:hypothetical protein